MQLELTDQEAAALFALIDRTTAIDSFLLPQTRTPQHSRGGFGASMASGIRAAVMLGVARIEAFWRYFAACRSI
jgi:phage I-like protein